MRGRSALEMLPPESQTSIRTSARLRLLQARTLPPGPAAAIAFRKRLSSTWRTWSASTSAKSPPGSTSTWTPEARGSVRQQLDRLLHQLVQGAPLTDRRRGTGEGQEVIHQLAEAIRFPGEDGDQASSLGIAALGEQLRRAAHRGEGIPDLVGQLGRERPHLGEAVGSPELVLGTAELGEILEDHQQRAGGGVQRGDRQAEDPPTCRCGHRHLRPGAAGEERSHPGNDVLDEDGLIPGRRGRGSAAPLDWRR